MFGGYCGLYMCEFVICFCLFVLFCVVCLFLFCLLLFFVLFFGGSFCVWVFITCVCCCSERSVFILIRLSVLSLL